MTLVIDMAECTARLTGKDLYWIDHKCVYRDLIRNGTLSYAHFEFDLSQYDEILSKNNKPRLVWTLSPAKAIEEACADMTEQFPNYFDKFVEDFFEKILGQLYPYLMPPEMMIKIATGFIQCNRDLALLYLDFKQKFPNNQFARFEDAIDLFKAKLENRFTNRSALIKRRGHWPYRVHQKHLVPPIEHDMIHEDEDSQDGRRIKKILFPYGEFLPLLLSRMEEGKTSGKRKNR